MKGLSKHKSNEELSLTNELKNLSYIEQNELVLRQATQNYQNQI